MPKSREAIKTKWAFKIKQDSGDGPDRFEARLAAKDFARKCDVDYDGTFLSVARDNTIRFLVGFAFKNEKKIIQMDAITAFLQGELTEEIYAEQPEGFRVGTNRVCRLNKAACGL